MKRIRLRMLKWLRDKLYSMSGWFEWRAEKVNVCCCNLERELNQQQKSVMQEFFDEQLLKMAEEFTEKQFPEREFGGEKIVWRKYEPLKNDPDYARNLCKCIDETELWNNTESEED